MDRRTLISAAISVAAGAFSMALDQLDIHIPLLGLVLATVSVFALLYAIWHGINEWREKRGKPGLKMQAAYIIILGLLIALCGSGWLLFQRPAAATLKPTPQEIDKLVSARLATMPTKVTPAQAAPADLLLENPYIEVSGGRVILHGIFSRSGGKLVVYLDLGQFGNTVVGNSRGVTDGTPGTMKWPRMEIGVVERFSRGQDINFPVATLVSADGNQQIYQWGDEKYNNTKVGATWGDYVARVVLVGLDDKEESYPFISVSRTLEMRAVPPVIIGPKILNYIPEWK